MPIQFLRRALPLALFALLSTAARADDKPRCQYVNIGELPLRYTGEAFRPALDGFINGTPAPMLVDTGADKTMLTMPLVKRLDLAQRMTGRHVNGIGGMSRLYDVRLDDVTVGPTHTGRITLPVIDETGRTPEYDALLGADFLFQSDFEIALTEKKIRFFRPHDCKDSFLGYWSQDAVQVPFTGSFGQSRNKVFKVKLNGVELDAVIDSGASRSVVFVNGAKKAGVLTDSPGTVKIQDGVGIGSEHLSQWRAMFKTFAIGNETIRDAELIIASYPSGGIQTDMLLGADFLRAHRVLFAMSQQKLYLSYLGGEIFSRGAVAIEPWLQKEADEGNPDAQFILANKYGTGSGVAKDLAAAASWLDKAAQQGHARANYQIGRTRLRGGKYTESAELFRNALRKQPDNTLTALYLYLAQLYAGDAGAARELEARVAADKERRWPAPVADYYLGRIDAAQLLEQAGKPSAQARSQTCDAKFMMSELAGAQGDKDKAKALGDAWRAECGRPAAL